LVAALKTARYALGWSQKDLAKASGISKVTIARMEAGMMSPRLDTLSALQLTMERAGASFALNQPAGGFTLRVEPKAFAEVASLEDDTTATHPEMDEGSQKSDGATASEVAGYVRGTGKADEYVRRVYARTRIERRLPPGSEANPREQGTSGTTR
jgi:transcriptional regulator with XRE-family HTH domain